MLGEDLLPEHNWLNLSVDFYPTQPPLGKGRSKRLVQS
jgi:hypothetical protein